MEEQEEEIKEMDQEMVFIRSERKIGGQAKEHGRGNR